MTQGQKMKHAVTTNELFDVPDPFPFIVSQSGNLRLEGYVEDILDYDKNLPHDENQVAVSDRNNGRAVEKDYSDSS
jgi:hypothetical protein